MKRVYGRVRRVSGSARHGCRAPPRADTLEACPPTTPPPPLPRRTAWGHGLATVAADGTVLDTWFPAPALGAPDADIRSMPVELEASPAATTAAR